MGKTPTTLIIMDGFGLTQPGPGNAVSLANTPVLDRLWADYEMCIRDRHYIAFIRR